MKIKELVEYFSGADVFRNHFEEERRILEAHGGNADQTPLEVGADAALEILANRVRNYPRLAGTLFIRATGLDMVRRGIDTVNRHVIRTIEKGALKNQ